MSTSTGDRGHAPQLAEGLHAFDDVEDPVGIPWQQLTARLVDGSMNSDHACRAPRLGVGMAGAPVGPRATTLAVAIERDLARLGRRQVDTLVLESLDDEGAWELAQAYRAAGVATRLGVVATDAEDLRRAAHLEGLEWVEVPPGVHGDDPALATLRSRGVVVAVDPGGGPPPSWCTVRLLATTDGSDLDAALLGVETLRATPGG